MDDLEKIIPFYRDKKVFITGHTGFKGAWLSYILANAGAIITGYALPAPTEPNLFGLINLEQRVQSVIGDIRDFKALNSAYTKAAPDIVFHLAAQPIVRESYKNPVYTYETNVMGTVNILECVRNSVGTKSFVNITTDKVYKNNEWEWGYRENEPLDGFDPYSNSKSCSELVTHSYRNSFFDNGTIAISTARAGNVIGGGDFAKDRIIPDCVRSVIKGEPVLVRNPNSIRPYQHVLEPLFAYLLIAKKQLEDRRYAGWYNVGPVDSDCVSTETLVGLFCSSWGDGARWESGQVNGPHEANFLKLDCSKIKSVFRWVPRWHISEAIEKTCEWTRVWANGGDVQKVMDKQIMDYVEG